MPFKVELVNIIIEVDTVDKIFEYDEDFDNNSHKCENSFYKDVQQIIANYNGYEYCIKRFRGMNISYFCGYILIDDPELVKNPNLYIPHGDFTSYFGFDCCHCDDLAFFGELGNDINKCTYKSFPYVRNECFKIIDSIIAIKS